MGSLTNALLARSDSLRSTHPTHSCGFIGPLAEDLSSIDTSCVFADRRIFEALVE